MCKYFNHIIKIEDFDIGNILLDKKSYKNIFIYDFLYITFTSAKSLHIIFNNLDGFTRDYDGNKHLILLGPEKDVAILIGLKSCMVNYAKLNLIQMMICL